jgi:hypothetical protein
VAALVALIVLSVVDALLALLLIALSGFTFGYHEGLHGDPSAVAVWSGALAACVGAPTAGFVLRNRGKVEIGILIAAVPTVSAFLLAFVF